MLAALERTALGGHRFVPLPPERVLERAKSNLRQHFAAVGLTERFDESVALFGHALGWSQLLGYESRNRSQNRPLHDTISREVLNKVEADNALDIALYQYAQGLFGEQRERYGLA